MEARIRGKELLIDMDAFSDAINRPVTHKPMGDIFPRISISAIFETIHPIHPIPAIVAMANFGILLVCLGPNVFTQNTPCFRFRALAHLDRLSR